ncbi:alpha/beta fold hydrolase [Candidatus Mycoplasma pogonae]
MKFINLLNSSIEYKAVIRASSKATLVYLHGFGGSFARMDFFVENFEKYSIYGLNMPFHGNTKFDDLSEVNVFYYAEIVNQFVTKLELKNVILIGHSMGGAVAALAASEEPYLYQKVCLIAPLNKTSTNLKELFLEKFYPTTIKERLKFLDLVYYDAKKFKADPSEILAASQYVNLINNDKLFSTTIKMLGKHLVSNNLLDAVEKALQKLELPTLLIYGDSDNIIDLKNIAQYYQQHTPHLTIAVIPQSGHIPWVENQESFVHEFKKFLNN